MIKLLTLYHFSINILWNQFYFPLFDIFCKRAFRLGPIWSGCVSQRWVLRASLVLNFSSHTLQRKGALTTSWTDLSLVLPEPAQTLLLTSRRHSVTWHTWETRETRGYSGYSGQQSRVRCLKGDGQLVNLRVFLLKKIYKNRYRLYVYWKNCSH